MKNAVKFLFAIKEVALQDTKLNLCDVHFEFHLPHYIILEL